MKDKWEKILRLHLRPDPAQLSNDKLYANEHRNDFFTPSDLIVTIKTKHKHYTFGGPVYSASVNLRDDKIIVMFIAPRRYDIKWEKVIGIDLQFLMSSK